MLDFEELETTNPICQPSWWAGSRVLSRGLFQLPRKTKIEVVGLENLQSAGLAIVSANHTHRYDFLPIRFALSKHDIQLVSWIKARDYRKKHLSHVLSKMGNIPIASRGYLIAADFTGELGRPPTEEEYRQLRNHVDLGTELNDQMLSALARPRSIMGSSADPDEHGYAGAIRHAYYEFMMTTLQKAPAARDAGRHQHIYPQGATSSQLTPGKIGAVQAAIALGLPIVPVGISGCREVFVGPTPFSRGGRVNIRFGEPMYIPNDIVPADFRPYHPEDEAAHQDVLAKWTQDLMERIDDLCDPHCRWADDLKSDAKQGIDRFFSL